MWCKYVFPCVPVYDVALVLGRHKVREGLSAKCDPLGQTARRWVGQSEQEYTWGWRTSKKFSLTLDWGQEGCIREALWEDWCSSMYITTVVQMPVWQEPAQISIVLFVCYYDYLALHYLSVIVIVLYSWYGCRTDYSLFSQVKNKPWLSWVYSWIRYCHEHLFCIDSINPVCCMNGLLGGVNLSWDRLQVCIDRS